MVRRVYFFSGFIDFFNEVSMVEIKLSGIFVFMATFHFTKELCQVS